MSDYVFTYYGEPKFKSPEEPHLEHGTIDVAEAMEMSH